MSVKIDSIGKQVALQRPREVNKSLRLAADAIKNADVQQQEADAKIQDPNAISKAVEQIQKLCDMFDRKLQFKVNEKTNRVVVKVIDTNTEKVIREIPSEEIQRLQERLKETVGLLFDKTI